jgi:DNA-directed RNA polymerase specialized sigma24 family protein
MDNESMALGQMPKDIREILWRLKLKTKSNKSYQVFYMYYIEGIPYDEISSKTGLTPFTCMQYASTLKRRFKAEWEKSKSGSSPLG